MWVRSGVQLLRSDVSRLVFLGKVELGVQKLGHSCALKLWKESGREPREDKEGIWGPGVTSWLQPVSMGGFRVT